MKRILLIGAALLAAMCSDDDGAERVTGPTELNLISFNIRYPAEEDTGDLAWDVRKKAVIEMIRREQPDVNGFQDPRWNFLWLLLPVLGWLLMWLTRGKHTEGEARTFVDRVIGNVWFVMGLTAMFVSLLTLFTPIRLPILFIILLIMGMGTAVTGLIIRFTPAVAGGTAAIVLAPLTMLVGNMWQPLLFIVGFVVMMIVPGHILNHTSNHPQR